MIACSQEAYEERLDAAAATSAAHATEANPHPGKYFSDEYRDYRASMEAAVDEVNHLLQHIHESGGVNRHIAERINILRPGFINPTRPLTSFTTDYTKTHYQVSQEGLMDTLKTFKDNVVKFLTALIKKVTDWVMNVFKSWRKDNDNSKEALTEVEEDLKKYDQAFEHIVDALRIIYMETHPTHDSPASMVCDVNLKIIKAVGLSELNFTNAAETRAGAIEYLRQIRSDMIGKKVSGKLNSFLHRLVKGDALTRCIIQNLVLDVQKRLPEIAGRLEKINRHLVFGESYVATDIMRSQELVNIVEALGNDVTAPILDLTDDIADAVETMFNSPMSTFYSDQTEKELLKADLLLDTLSGVDASYLKQLREIEAKGRHLEGIMNAHKTPMDDGLRLGLIDISENLSSISQVLEILKVIGLGVRALVLSFDASVRDIDILAKKFIALITKLQDTSHIKAATDLANQAASVIR
jgi:hypothetical protein